MKHLIFLPVLFFSFMVNAETINIPAEFEIIQAFGSCQEVACVEDEDTLEQKCRYKIYFDEASFNQINQLKREKGYNKTWFSKSPNEICANGELPVNGEGNDLINVMLYKLDLGILSEQF